MNHNDRIEFLPREDLITPGDAKRLVACWNACIGIDTKLLKPRMLAEQAKPVAWPFRCGQRKLVRRGHAQGLLREMAAWMRRDGVGDCEAVELVSAYIDAIEAAPPAPARQEPLTDAARDVLVERQRQVSAEGWTPEHDDEHVNSELSHAAGIYAIYGDVSAYGASNPPADWPWAAEWWKPSASQRRNLVKAAALILAEIERLDRAAPITAAPAEGEKR